MITDQFLTSCYKITLSKTPNDPIIQSDRKIFHEILDILQFYENQKTIDIPINLKNKFECLKDICKFKTEGMERINIVNTITAMNKYSSIYDFMKYTVDEELTLETTKEIINQIKFRLKLVLLLSKNYDKLNDFFDKVRSGNFSSEDHMLKEFEDFIKEQHMIIMEYERQANIENAKGLDVCDDSWDGLVDQIKSRYDRANKIPTGFQIFDDEIFYGGFDPGRLYMFGGGSGSGKSTLMINLIKRASDEYGRRKKYVEKKEVKEVDDDIDNISIYITLENPIDETIFRLYMCIFNKSQDEALEDVRDGKDIRDSIIKHFKDNNSNVIMKFYPAYSIGCYEIMNVLDDAIAKYTKNKIKAIYIDYLDLLKSHRTSEMYRLELSYIAATLKVIANFYNIPVITATQLNRSVYTILSADELNLNQMSEAIKKVEHADFVLLMGMDKIKSNKIHAKVGKNRCGKNNVPLEFIMDFEKYRVDSCHEQIKTNEKEVEKSITAFENSSTSFDI